MNRKKNNVIAVIGLNIFLFQQSDHNRHNNMQLNGGSLLSVFCVRVSVTFHLTCDHIILVLFRLLVATFWEIAAHSVDHMLSLHLTILSVWTWVLIASVLDLCILFTFRTGA